MSLRDELVRIARSQKMQENVCPHGNPENECDDCKHESEQMTQDWWVQQDQDEQWIRGWCDD